MSISVLSHRSNARANAKPRRGRGRLAIYRSTYVGSSIASKPTSQALIKKENMRTHLLSSIVLVCFSGFLVQLGATSASQHSAIKKREEGESFQDAAFCFSSLIDYICSSNWAPYVLNQLAVCGEREFHDIIVLRSTCAVSERGDFCGSASFLYDQDGTRLMDIQNNCSAVLESGSNCPSNCRTLLEELKENLGCCISFINDTQQVPAVVNYRVWNTCNISLPAKRCDNGLIIDNFSSFHRCSDAELYHRVYRQALCRPSVGQPYVNFLLMISSRCPYLLLEARYVVNLCSFNEAEFPCELFSEREVDSLDSICELSFMSGNCSSECKGRIKELSNSLGCCVNHYNTSDSPPLGLSYSLWASCEVESPGFCESSLKLSVETDAGSGTVSILVELCIIFSAVIVTFLRV